MYGARVAEVPQPAGVKGPFRIMEAGLNFDRFAVVVERETAVESGKANVAVEKPSRLLAAQTHRAVFYDFPVGIGKCLTALSFVGGQGELMTRRNAGLGMHPGRRACCQMKPGHTGINSQAFVISRIGQ